VSQELLAQGGFTEATMPGTVCTCTESTHGIVDFEITLPVCTNGEGTVKSR
jgi:hypothetical protein